MEAASRPPSLRRAVGQLELTLGGVGIILGAGIYALVGAVAQEARDGIWLSFLITAVMAAIIGLCYAELSSMFPRAGADYEYARRSMGERPAFVVGWLMVVSNLVAASTVALGFAGYFRTFVDAGLVEVAIVVLLAGALVAYVGIKQAVWVAVVLTLFEAGGLLLIIGTGIPHFGNLDLGASQASFAGIASGAALVMFAYTGFEQIVTLAEETQAPERTVPRAILSAIAITSVLYLMVALAGLAVVGAERLALSDSPLVEVVDNVLGQPRVRCAGVDCAHVDCEHGAVDARGRVAADLRYGIDGGTSPVPGGVQPGVRTPARAIVVSALVSAGFVFLEDISLVASAANFAVFIAFGAACLSVLLLRWRRPDAPRPFRTPLNPFGVPLVPLAGLGCVAFLTANLSGDALLLGLGIFISGIVALVLQPLWRPAGEESAAIPPGTPLPPS